MAKLSHSVSAELRLFAFYLSNGSLSNICDDILSDDFDLTDCYANRVYWSKFLRFLRTHWKLMKTEEY